MNYAYNSNLLTLIDSADERGFVTLCPFKDPFEEKPLSGQAAARVRLETEFGTGGLAMLRIRLVKKAITEIDLSWENTPAGPAFSFNLAKLFQLPAQAPREELSEFRALLNDMRDFLQANAMQKCDIQIGNCRDNHRRVYGELSCRIPTGDYQMRRDEEATTRIKARIAASSALSHWLQQVARTLQKIGPWSWTCIREDELFGYTEGPYLNCRNSLPPQEPAKPEKLRQLFIED